MLRYVQKGPCRSTRIQNDKLLTMFCDIYDGVLSPPEEEVPEGQAEYQRQAQPHVVRHEHQHQNVGRCGLN